MVICLNCGASFSENAPQCPYCGRIYIPGAEKEYLDNLQKLREDLSEIEELSEAIYQNEIKKKTKKAGVIIAVMVVILLLGVGLFTGMDRLFSFQESEDEIKARILWERENFPTLDVWYEAGEYQKILDFMEDTYEEKGSSYSLIEWEHYRFIEYFEFYQICMEIKNRLLKGEEISEFDAGELLYCGMSVINYEKDNLLSEAEMFSISEKEILSQWKQDIEVIFSEALGYSADEMQKLQKTLYEEGYLSYDACCELRTDVLERIRQ